MPLQIQRAALPAFMERLRAPRRFLQVVAGPGGVELSHWFAHA